MQSAADPDQIPRPERLFSGLQGKGVASRIIFETQKNLATETGITSGQNAGFFSGKREFPVDTAFFFFLPREKKTEQKDESPEKMAFSEARFLQESVHFEL
jgi:hypothetical protein